MTKIKSKANEGATKVVPKFGPERHRQLLRQTWAAERHKLTPGTAKQGTRKR
jgi:hypothetical protein